jgi:hypothetical protein
MVAKVKVRRKKGLIEDRRRGSDDKLLTQDINLYRWFAVFTKCALELEGQTFTLRDKTYPIKFDKNHKWWKLIDLKSFPKSPKFIRFENKLLPSQQSKLFGGFHKRYRDLFLEKSTIIGQASKVPHDYSSFHFPPDYPVRQMLSDVKNFYKNKEVKLKSGRKKRGEQSRYNADIVLNDSTESLMKRLFHTLSLDQSSPDLTNLDLFFNIQKRMYKTFKIPEITRKNAGTWDGRSTRSSRQDYESNIRSTQRDKRHYKTLILNLCKGQFPKIDKLI